ncbi:hypothetical protein ACA910_017560 [Epithemia clementina (nom. ined.)]
MDLCFFPAKHQSACELNNLAVELLQRGHFQVAHASFRTALSILQQACQSVTTDAAGQGSVQYERATREAQNGLFLDRLVHSACHVEAIAENQANMPSSIFHPQVLSNSIYFEAHPYIVNFDPQQRGNGSSSSDFDFHCAAVLYNFALSKLCIYSVEQGDGKMVVEGIQLFRMAFEQLSISMCSKAENNEINNSSSDENNEQSNLPVLCALLLSNLARALPLISEHDEAQEMCRRLSVIASHLYAYNGEDDYDDDCDDYTLFHPTAAPAA